MAKCVNACVKYIDKIICYVTNLALTCVAVYGTSFFTSARKATVLIATNAKHLLVVKFVTNFFFFLAKFCVIVGSLVIGWCVNLW